MLPSRRDANARTLMQLAAAVRLELHSPRGTLELEAMAALCAMRLPDCEDGLPAVTTDVGLRGDEGVKLTVRDPSCYRINLVMAGLHENGVKLVEKIARQIVGQIVGQWLHGCAFGTGEVLTPTRGAPIGSPVLQVVGALGHAATPSAEGRVMGQPAICQKRSQEGWTQTC